MTSIMYACEYCLHHSPESSGRFTPEELRVLPSGLWICDDCYESDDSIPDDCPDWGDLLPPPNYVRDNQQLRDSLREALAFCDGAQHPTDQYANDRDRLWLIANSAKD